MNLPWVEFYSEFATKLLTYKNNRSELIRKIQNVFDSIQMKFPKMESDGKLIDIDPFSIYGTFNKGITRMNRIAIASGMAQEFGVHSTVPETFEGIPIVNNLAACFFHFKEGRGANDIQNLWEVFESALALVETDNDENRGKFIYYYDLVRKQKGIRWNITMGLYWIRPLTFVTLDETNRKFISDTGNMPVDFVAQLPSFKKTLTGKEYLSLCNDCRDALNQNAYPYRTFPEMSHRAWMHLDSKSENENTAIPSLDSSFLRWMRPVIQALRDLGGSATPSKVCERIAENENLDPEETSATRGKSQKNKFVHDVAFARLFLVHAGYIDKSVRGIWSLTEEGKNVYLTDELIKEIFQKYRGSKLTDPVPPIDPIDRDVKEIHYWLYAPGHGASRWEEFYTKGIMSIVWGEIGDLSTFDSKDEMNEKMKETYDPSRTYIHAAHATWQFAKEMKVGDVVFVKKGMHQLVGRGIVTSDYIYDPLQDEHYCNIRKVKWLEKGTWAHPGQAVTKTLTNITLYTDYVESLNALFTDENDNEV
ncbi:MAG: winged helix-turn-helix domain-containing protein, partial [Planctomycetia bacterium]|nr:winged helix-turn-helix domain-containing protein [Planctomycetia bacterium]